MNKKTSNTNPTDLWLNLEFRRPCRANLNRFAMQTASPCPSKRGLQIAVEIRCIVVVTADVAPDFSATDPISEIPSESSLLLPYKED